MTDDKKKKHDDKDRKKLSDEELEDVAGGDIGGHLLIEARHSQGQEEAESRHLILRPRHRWVRFLDSYSSSRAK